MIKRIFTPLLEEMLATFPVVAVVGSRQVGKSTLIQQPDITKGRHYLTLDDLSAYSVAQADPKGFLDGEKPLSIDEVQLAPALLREIKLLVDRKRVPGRFLLTGSSDLDHCADISSVLAGRVGILRLPPIAISEQHQAKGWRKWMASTSVKSLDTAFAGMRHPILPMERIVAGGYPDSLLAATDRRRMLWMESFKTTYLERDLRRISDIGNLGEFVRLMNLSAAATGCLLNQAHLARDVGMSPATAGRHLSILEASFLITRLPPFFANIGKRMVKAPKLYWNDVGLAAHLCGITSTEALRKSMLYGRFVETLIMMEIQALLPLADEPARLFHVRTHDGLEVDGLLEIGQRHLPIEIKASKTVTASDAAAIEKWIGLNPKHGPGIVLHFGEDYVTLSKNVRGVPVGALFGPAIET
jgi:predicted AAA+ superfamily ATPase